jgi:hypothetical protein
VQQLTDVTQVGQPPLAVGRREHARSHPFHAHDRLKQ